MILPFPHQDLGHITCVWTTLFQAVPDFCSEPAAYSSPCRTNSQQPGFLLKANDSYSSNIPEKDMQEDQCAFLLPWSWLLLVSSDSHKARTLVPVMGCSFFLCTSPQAPLELPGLFAQRVPALLAVVTDSWRWLHFKYTRIHPGQFTVHLSTLGKLPDFGVRLGSNSCVNSPATFLLPVSYYHLPHRYLSKIQKITCNSPVTDAKWYSWIYHGSNTPQPFQFTTRFLHAWLDLQDAELPAASLLLVQASGQQAPGKTGYNWLLIFMESIF